MRVGIVICSRSDSSRIPNKPFKAIKNKFLIEHLLDNLRPLHIPICVATPSTDATAYTHFLKNQGVLLYNGNDKSPLHRTLEASKLYGFDLIVRITHDKIFVDIDSLDSAIQQFKRYAPDISYLYSSHLTEGAGFEIFTKEVLEKACEQFKDENIEHISYAIKSVTAHICNYKPSAAKLSDARLLIDFPEDLDLIQSIYHYAGNSSIVRLPDALRILEEKPWLKKINKLPDITIYTCVYNQESLINWCIQSVISQTIFPNVEYIIIDDCSTDDTYKTLVNSKYFSNKLIKLKRNTENLGLSSSSNIALNMARGKYIMRVDADDALLFPFTLEKMLKKAKEENLDALYPMYADESTKRFEHGSTSHHVGGCLFLTKTIRNIQFTEKLRGWEGIDLFERAKNQIRIGYFEELGFFYRDTKNSMSKSSPEYRESIRKMIADGKVGKALV